MHTKAPRRLVPRPGYTFLGLFFKATGRGGKAAGFRRL